MEILRRCMRISKIKNRQKDKGNAGENASIPFFSSRLKGFFDKKNENVNHFDIYEDISILFCFF